MRAAIIDDGINNSVQVNHMVHWKVINGAIKKSDGRKGVETHGTTCIKILFQCYPKASSVVDWDSIEVLNHNNLTCNTESLLAALDFCKLRACKFVHLSIGSVYPKDERLLAAKIFELISAGVIIVSAMSNKARRTYPASLPGVIAVAAARFTENVPYFASAPNILQIDFLANAEHSLIDLNGNLYRTNKSNSYAAPVVSAEVLKFINDNHCESLKEIFLYLRPDSNEESFCCWINQKEIFLNKKWTEMDIQLPLCDSRAMIAKRHFQNQAPIVSIEKKVEQEIRFYDRLVEQGYICLEISISDEYMKPMIIRPLEKLAYCYNCDILLVIQTQKQINQHSFDVCIMEKSKNLIEMVVSETNKIYYEIKEKAYEKFISILT